MFYSLLNSSPMKRAVHNSGLVWCNRLLKVNNGNEGQGCYREILRAIADQMEAILSHHSRVLVIRFDLHVSTHTPDNRLLSRYMDKLKRHLHRTYGIKRMGFVWAREQERAKKQHYHIAIMLDGNQIQNPSRLLAWIDKKWQARDQPKVFVPENCFKMVKRSSLKSFDDAFYRLSYLAKVRGKGYRPSSVNDYSTSRIKPKSITKKQNKEVLATEVGLQAMEI